MLGMSFSFKLNWGSYITTIVKTEKIEALIFSVKFLPPEVALYLYKSTIRPGMECCCHFWTGTPSCYLDILDKLQKRVCQTVGPTLAASLSPQFTVEALLWHSVNWLKCFHLILCLQNALTYDVNSFRSRIYKHLLSAGSFKHLFVCF